MPTALQGYAAGTVVFLIVFRLTLPISGLDIQNVKFYIMKGCFSQNLIVLTFNMQAVVVIRLQGVFTEELTPRTTFLLRAVFLL